MIICSTCGHQFDDDPRDISDACPQCKTVGTLHSTWFVKHHTCECGETWNDEWDCNCDDECPNCGCAVQPDDTPEEMLLPIDTVAGMMG